MHFILDSFANWWSLYTRMTLVVTCYTSYVSKTTFELLTRPTARLMIFRNRCSMFDVLLIFDNQFSLSCSLIVSLKSLHLSDSLMIKFYYKFRAHFYSSLYSWYNGLTKEHDDSHALTMEMPPITGYWRWNSQGNRR